MKLTIHVLFAWPAGSDPDDPDHPPRHHIFVEHGNEDEAWMAAQEMAGRYHATNQHTDLNTVHVDSTREDPVKAALNQALHQIGVQDPGHRDALRVGAGRQAKLARTVSAAEAAGHLSIRYGLTVDPDAGGLDLVLLRLARRATLGDAESEIALGVFAEEHRRARAHADHVPPEVDPLTFANSAGGDQR